MTSDVMAATTPTAHDADRRAARSSALEVDMPRIEGKDAALGIVWIAFVAYSLVVIAGHGYTGFLVLAWREPWGMQMLLDLAIALSLFAGFLVTDAKTRGLRAWPWLLAMATLGSIGAVPYLWYRRAFPARP